MHQPDSNTEVGVTTRLGASATAVTLTGTATTSLDAVEPVAVSMAVARTPIVKPDESCGAGSMVTLASRVDVCIDSTHHMGQHFLVWRL